MYDNARNGETGILGTIIQKEIIELLELQFLLFISQSKSLKNNTL